METGRKTWEDGYERAFKRIYESAKNELETYDMEDALQEETLKMLTRCSLDRKPEKGSLEDGNLQTFETSHLTNHLMVYARKRKIVPSQQREKLVSLNNEETGEEVPYLVHVPKDNDLYKFMLKEGNFTTREKKVIAKRYLAGKSIGEVSRELDISQPTLWRVNQSIDRKIIKLQLKNNISTWAYNGSGYSNKGEVWKAPIQNGPIFKGRKVYEPKPDQHKVPSQGKVPSPYQEDGRGWIVGSMRSGSLVWSGRNPVIRFQEVWKQAMEDNQRKVDSLSFHYYQNVDGSPKVNHWSNR